VKWERILNKRFVITNAELNKRIFQVFAEYDERNRLMDVTCEPSGIESILGNIYIGRVKDIVTNLNAAFIDIGNHITCFYSLEDLKSPIFTHKIGKKLLCEGDELVVQITKEAVKTKFPVVSTNLNFAGNYVILTTENHKLGISGKLEKEKKTVLKELFSEEDFTNYGLIVRTNAGDATSDVIISEYHQLQQEYEDLIQTCKGKTAFSCLKMADPFYVKAIRSRSFDETDQIITDHPLVYQQLMDGMCSQHPVAFELRLYEDNSYPLSSLYPVASGIEDALKERVWLKSGAYLVISPTEALTVIDVNSGKNVASKNKQENILKINQESAIEIARQLKLRNISGICIVDFINMNTKTDMDALMHTFRVAIKEDTIATQLVDITKLGLVELTRKKEKKSLYEQIYTSN
jgi:ribonuclease G